MGSGARFTSSAWRPTTCWRRRGRRWRHARRTPPRDRSRSQTTCSSAKRSTTASTRPSTWRASSVSWSESRRATSRSSSSRRSNRPRSRTGSSPGGRTPSWTTRRWRSGGPGRRRSAVDWSRGRTTRCQGPSSPPLTRRRSRLSSGRSLPSPATLTSAGGCWVATERIAAARSIEHDDDAAAECVFGHLAVAGPVSAERLVADGPLPSGLVRGAPLSAGRARSALARLEGAGSAIQLTGGEWCARHLLVRMHAASRSRRRSRVEPASIAQFVQFLARWQHVAPGTQLEGRSGLLGVIEQLAGYEAAAGAWERHLFPARVVGYEPSWLDELCLSGEVAWGRLAPRGLGSDPTARRGGATPSSATPLAFARREDLGWLLAAVRAGEQTAEPSVGAAADLLAVLRSRGASFRADLVSATGRLPSEVDEGLWDLVARGLVTADAFSAVRQLLRARPSRPRAGPPQRRLARRRARTGSGVGEGRWSLMPSDVQPPTDELAEAVASQLLERWGVVSWELWSQESFRVPWRAVIGALRRFEARGVALGGRFVAGLSGEQYALGEAAQLLASVRRDQVDETVVVAGSDPLNLTGAVLGGARVPAVRNRMVSFRAGVVVEEHALA